MLFSSTSAVVFDIFIYGVSYLQKYLNNRDTPGTLLSIRALHSPCQWAGGSAPPGGARGLQPRERTPQQWFVHAKAKENPVCCYIQVTQRTAALPAHTRSPLQKAGNVLPRVSESFPTVTSSVPSRSLKHPGTGEMFWGELLAVLLDKGKK